MRILSNLELQVVGGGDLELDEGPINDPGDVQTVTIVGQKPDTTGPALALGGTLVTIGATLVGIAAIPIEAPIAAAAVVVVAGAAAVGGLVYAYDYLTSHTGGG
jgi:hypothetical protein